jgi:predicted NACHT family NTPase
MERVAAWRVENAVGFVFKTLLEELAQENLEEYTKSFFQEDIKDWRGLGKQEQLEIALGQALKEFLQLVQQALEDADCSEEELKQYTESLSKFLHDTTVLVELGKPFQDVVLKANLTPPAPLPYQGRGENCSPLLAGEGQGERSAAQYCDADKLEQTWQELNLLALPDEFDWKGIAKRYKKKVDAILRESKELLAVLSDEATAEVASDSDLIGYRKAIQQTYGYLKLDTLHTSGYSYRLQLLNIFVAQDVREVKEALPQLLELPKEHLERLIKTGQLEADAINPDIIESCKQSYAQETTRSVSELIEDGQTYPYLVILGDPGSGKSSLVQYIALQWAATAIEESSSLPLPLLIELRRYVQSRDKQKCQNFVEFCQQGHGFIYPLHPQQLNERLRTGKVFVLFDGLDEVFEASKRDEVITEIIRFTQDYPQVRVLVTSRVIGYQSQRLRDAKFHHFMLQDLEAEQIQGFLTRWHELAFGAGEEAEILHYPPSPPYQGGNKNRKLALPLPEQEGNQSLKLACPLPEQEGNQSLELACPLPEQEGNQSLKLASPLSKGGLRGVNNDSGARFEESKKKQERLQQAIEESPAIGQLAGNPLLLTMMAILNRNQELPRNRAELYEQASKVLLQQWDLERALVNRDAITIDFKDKQAMLRRVAYQMQGNDKGLAGNLINAEDLEGILTGYLEKNLDISDAGANAKSIVKQLRERNFILCFLGADYYAFVHRTFLEYFCAWEFVWQFQKERSLSLEELEIEVFGKYWQDESWHEVLRLIAGMIDTSFAGEIIEYLMALHNWGNLILAAECLLEVRNRSRLEATATKLINSLKSLTQYEDDELPYDYEEEDPFYKIRTQAVTAIAKTWKDEPDTLSWLKTRVVSDQYWTVRQAAVREIARGWKDNLETLSWLKSQGQKDTAIRWVIVQEIARSWKDDPNTLPWLKLRAQSDDYPYVRTVALQELAIGWKDDPGLFEFFCARAVSDPFEEDGENTNPRQTALEAIITQYPNHPQTLPLLHDRVRHDLDGDLRRLIVRELAKGWKNDPKTLPLLKDCIQSDDAVMRYEAVQGLVRGWNRRWKDDPDTLPLLKACVQADEDCFVRKLTVQVLARGWKDDPETLPILKTRALSDDNAVVRRMAVEELAKGWKDEPWMFEFLYNCALNDPFERQEDWENNPRQLALEIIIKQYPDHPQTLPLCKDRAENDPDEKVREFAQKKWEQLERQN